MKTKPSNANLYLYTFLSILLGLAATVDIGSLSSQAMANQNDRAEMAVQRWGL